MNLMKTNLMTTNFKTVSFRGGQLTDNERRRLADQNRVNSFLNTHLTSLFDEALANQKVFEEQGGQAEKLWHLELQQSSAPYLGDAFIF